MQYQYLMKTIPIRVKSHLIIEQHTIVCKCFYFHSEEEPGRHCASQHIT